MLSAKRKRDSAKPHRGEQDAQHEPLFLELLKTPTIEHRNAVSPVKLS